MSVLDKTISKCEYYSRDCGEELYVSKYSSFDEFDERANKHSYAYIFKDGQWYGRRYNGNWMLASDMLTQEY